MTTDQDTTTRTPDQDQDDYWPATCTCPWITDHRLCEARPHYFRGPTDIHCPIHCGIIAIPAHIYSPNISAPTNWGAHYFPHTITTYTIQAGHAVRTR